jgi:uncharacterized protein YdhG (YjbR/CyaY superfamily)
MSERQGSVDAYLAGIEEPARATLARLRATIKAMAPEAEESISYGMPAYKYRGRPLIYFGTAKNHCAIYGVDSEVAERAGFDTSHKGTVRFPPEAPPPDALMRQLLDLRVRAIDEALAKKRSKASPEASK